MDEEKKILRTETKRYKDCIENQKKRVMNTGIIKEGQ